jgi:hypothetical protein
MEANEVQEFANQMKESGEGGGESLKTISLAISILAVLVAMVTVLGHRSHTEAVLMQSRAGDQWNEYQAKKIRMENLSVDIDLLALQPSNDAAAVTAKAKEYQAHIDRWKVDLAEEQDKAYEFEREVTHAESQASHYDLGEALGSCSAPSPSSHAIEPIFFLGWQSGLRGSWSLHLQFLSLDYWHFLTARLNCEGHPPLLDIAQSLRMIGLIFGLRVAGVRLGIIGRTCMLRSEAISTMGLSSDDSYRG